MTFDPLLMLESAKLAAIMAPLTDYRYEDAPSAYLEDIAALLESDSDVAESIAGLSVLWWTALRTMHRPMWH